MTDIEWAIVHYDGNNDEPYADLVVDALRQKRDVDALATEYGIDAKTMLTLAKSQIKTTQSNIELQDKINILESGLINLKENGFCATCTGCNAPHDPNRTTWCTSWEYKHE